MPGEQSVIDGGLGLERSGLEMGAQLPGLADGAEGRGRHVQLGRSTAGSKVWSSDWCSLVAIGFAEQASATDRRPDTAELAAVLPGLAYPWLPGDD